MFVPSQDQLVGVVSIVLGMGALTIALSGGRLAKWSAIAQGLQNRGGNWAVAIIYGLIGLFLIGVGISLLK